jgi:hypothetical protein
MDASRRSRYSPKVTTTQRHFTVRVGAPGELNPLFEAEHYLGPLASHRLILVAEHDGEVVAGQVWKWPTSRSLPSDGSWLELSRWVLTARAGENAGSRFHAEAVRFLRENAPNVTTLVSYSDPSVGHTGALYRACNWSWCPVWHRLRPPPTAGGKWSAGGKVEAVKDRWVFALRRDDRRGEVLRVRDIGAMRHWLPTATEAELARARRSLSPDLRAFVEVSPATTTNAGD